MSTESMNSIPESPRSSPLIFSDYILSKFVQRHQLRKEVPTAVGGSLLNNPLMFQSLREYMINLNPKIGHAQVFDKPRLSDYVPGNLERFQKTFSVAKHFLRKLKPDDFDSNDNLEKALQLLKRDEFHYHEWKRRMAPEDNEALVRFAVYNSLKEGDLIRLFNEYKRLLLAKLISDLKMKRKEQKEREKQMKTERKSQEFFEEEEESGDSVGMIQSRTSYSKNQLVIHDEPGNHFPNRNRNSIWNVDHKRVTEGSESISQAELRFFENKKGSGISTKLKETQCSGSRDSPEMEESKTKNSQNGQQESQRIPTHSTSPKDKEENRTIGFFDKRNYSTPTNSFIKSKERVSRHTNEVRIKKRIRNNQSKLAKDQQKNIFGSERIKEALNSCSQVDKEMVSQFILGTDLSLNKLLEIGHSAPSKSLEEACVIYSENDQTQKYSRPNQKDKIKLVDKGGVIKELLEDAKKIRKNVDLKDERLVNEFQTGKRLEMITENRIIFQHLLPEDKLGPGNKLAVAIKLNKMTHMKNNKYNEVHQPPRRLMFPSKMAKNPLKRNTVPMESGITIEKKNEELEEIKKREKIMSELIKKKTEEQYCMTELEGKMTKKSKTLANFGFLSGRKTSTCGLADEPTETEGETEGNQRLFGSQREEVQGARDHRPKLSQMNLSGNGRVFEMRSPSDGNLLNSYGSESVPVSTMEKNKSRLSTFFSRNEQVYQEKPKMEETRKGKSLYPRIKEKNHQENEEEGRGSHFKTEASELAKGFGEIAGSCLKAKKELGQFKRRAKCQMRKMMKRMEVNGEAFNEKMIAMQFESGDKKEFDKFKKQREFKQEIITVLANQAEVPERTVLALKEKKRKIQKDQKHPKTQND